MRAIRYLALWLLLGACPLSAKHVAGVALEEQITLTQGIPLHLKGSAVRRLGQHVAYVGGLYLSDPHILPADVLDDVGPKRFLLHCKTAAISKDRWLDSWQQGLVLNNSYVTLGSLKHEIARFNQLWQKGIKEGDEVWLDYVPQQGTKISVNGRLVDTIPGELFYTALLRAWLGEHPMSTPVKNALLGIEPS